MSDSRYKADIAGGSLKIPESRVVAELLLNDIDAEGWKHAIEVENVLQKRSPGTAKRQSSLIRSRLQTMDRDLWDMVCNGSKQTATHAMFACAIKHSNLLGDFLATIVRDHFLTFKPKLPRSQWKTFIDKCYDLDPDMPEWTESTANKLGDSVYQILAEVGYLAGGREYILQPVRIEPDVMAYLRDNNEEYVLRCIQVSL